MLHDKLPPISRATREAEVPLFITDANDITETAAKQLAKESAAPGGE